MVFWPSWDFYSPDFREIPGIRDFSPSGSGFFRATGYLHKKPALVFRNQQKMKLNKQG